jgi:hypothetical protein
MDVIESIVPWMIGAGILYAILFLILFVVVVSFFIWVWRGIARDEEDLRRRMRDRRTSHRSWF